MAETKGSSCDPSYFQSVEPTDTKKAATVVTTKKTKSTPEIGGPKGLEPTRYGDWERKGIAVDF